LIIFLGEDIPLKVTDEKSMKKNVTMKSNNFVIPWDNPVIPERNLPFSELMRTMAKKYQNPDWNQQT
jgi:hypothetical protein